jgi:acyl-coenzyme A thioesterase PaaI-like protein
MGNTEREFPMKAAVFRRLMNLWPPFLFTGIRCVRLDEDFRAADVELRMGRLNRNYVGTHFGGSLFAMTDPFYMLMLLKNLGPGHVVWDKAATIDFVAPGRGTVTARFRLDEARIAEIRAACAEGAKTLPVFRCEITDSAGALVAVVERTVYVRRKRAA